MICLYQDFHGNNCGIVYLSKIEYGNVVQRIKSFNNHNLVSKWTIKLDNLSQYIPLNPETLSTYLTDEEILELL